MNPLRPTIPIVLLFTFWLNHLPAAAQTPGHLTLTGEVETPLTLTPSDFRLFQSLTRKAVDRDGKTHEFSGVALIDLLVKAGVTTGGKLRGKNLTKYLLIEAADGYEVVFSLAEIDPEFTNQDILVAISKDNQPLPAGEGPFRIIVPNDKKHARWIREVSRIQVVFAKSK